jgi:Fur family ferric uptake transcriptional regulator
MVARSAVPVRDTKQKRAIRRVFETATRPLSTDEILAEASCVSEGLGVATVYRAVRNLADEGFLTAVDVPGRPTLYERAGKSHHHHFVCDECERVYEIEGCDVKAKLPRGFRTRDHDVTVYGTCASCRQPTTAARGPLPDW